MEVDDLQTTAEGAANGVVRTAGKAVVPGDQHPGIVDEVIIADGIAAPVVDRGEHHGFGGLGQYTPETFAVGRGEAHLLPVERDCGDEPHVVMQPSEFQHSFGGSEVETDGHTTQEGSETPVVQTLQHAAQGVASLAAISTVTGEGDGCAGIGDHTSKGKVLARTLQVQKLNLNFQQL